MTPPTHPQKVFTNATIYSQHRDPPTRLRATDGAQGKIYMWKKRRKKNITMRKYVTWPFFSSLPFNSIGSARRWGKICGKLHRGERKAPLIRHRSGHSNSAPEGGIEDWVQGCLGKKKTTRQHSLPVDFPLTSQGQRKKANEQTKKAETNCTAIYLQG